MEPYQSGSSRPVISQDRNNTTRWLGHLKNDSKDQLAGQTFTSPKAGHVDNIQVYSSSVQYPGDVKLTLHEFHEDNKTWGPPIGQSNLSLDKKDEDKWVRFPMNSVELRQGSQYAFKLETDNAMIGLGEAAAPSRQPFDGREWKASSADERGDFFSYFSLAFRVELR
jgi:hypothetical protein